MNTIKNGYWLASRVAFAAIVCVVPRLALAANEVHDIGPPGLPPTIEKAEGDTLQMTCAQARSMVKGKGGVILKTGANHFDLYHRKDSKCDREEGDLQPAFTRTKDNGACFIGYTCSPPESD